MRVFLFVLLVVIGCFDAKSQISPGGVKRTAKWIVAENANSTFKLKELNSATILFNSSVPTNFLQSMNGHPALIVKGQNGITTAIDVSVLTSNTLFTVYQPLDTSAENILWHITNKEGASLALTTSRMADLASLHYMNYTVVNPAQPKINIYSHQKSASGYIGTSWHLNIGGLPAYPKLPIKSFNGLLPELIIYPRVLTSQERIRVASYLALKYGITLSEPNANYFSSSGDTIWDGNSYSTYHHDIAGLARDDSSGLRQTTSTSGNHPGQLTLQATDSLTNNSFLLWGNNNLPLSAGAKVAGMPQLLQKKWLVVQHAANPIKTSLLLNTKQVDFPMPDNPVYWMLIDTSGTGQFQPGLTKFIRMGGIDDNGFAHFNNLYFNNKNAINPAFAFAIGGKLIAATAITAPPCTAPRSGELAIKIVGGLAPYTLTLKSNNGQVLSYTLTTDTLLHIPHITAGKYYLYLNATTGDSYKDSFYVNNNGAPVPSTIQPSYILPKNGAVNINATVQPGANVQYAWQGPNQFSTASPVVKITQPGIYNLKVEKAGCIYQQDVVIHAAQQTPFDSVLVYPNPSPGIFKAKVALQQPADIVMTVFDNAGRPVLKKEGKGFANYLFTGNITTGGLYHVTFSAGKTTISKKLVISP